MDEIKINEWWRWDEMEDVLKNGRGNIRVEGRGKTGRESG